VCREQLPVWQQFYQQHDGEGIEVLAVAIDMQGPARVLPYVEQAQPTYTNAIDENNVLADLFGFKAVPNGVFLDQAGIVRYTKFGGFDIRKPEHAQIVERFAASQDLAELEREAEAPGSFRNPEALDYFQQGLALYRQGKVQAAMQKWRKGVDLEPDNYIIRKQIWAMENPERFYDGDVDFDWQREQLERGL
jgi:tetratricopeptide (TPR) repeat protein